MQILTLEVLPYLTIDAEIIPLSAQAYMSTIASWRPSSPDIEITICIIMRNAIRHGSTLHSRHSP